MPIETVIDKEQHRVTHRISGVLVYEEVLKSMKALYTNPEFRSDMEILAIFLPGATSGLSSDDIHRVVEMTRLARDVRGSGRTAVVAMDEQDFGIVHVAEYLLKDEKRQMKICRTVEEAEQWLKEAGK